MKTRVIAVLGVVLATGCDDGMAPPATAQTQADAPVPAPKPTAAPVKPVVVTGQGCTLLLLGRALDCLPDTPDGCVCGIPDAANHATGSCHRGACCSGCWDNGDAEHGVPPQCWPGDGTAGWYGSRGSGCRVQPASF